MRVVLDTNILISSCWTPGGNEWTVLERVYAGALEACVSDALLAEYCEVAERKKFSTQRECLRIAIARLTAAAERVAPSKTCDACSDPDDNRLLECAAAGGAQFVVTGNLRHFPASWDGIRTVNARALLDLLDETQARG